LKRAYADRFWEKTKLVGGCWEWQGCLDYPNGYGRSYFRGRSRRTHRIAFILAKGEIPDGLFVCHTCDNKKCCNPDHLFVGTYLDNIADKVAKNRQYRPYGELQVNAKLTDFQAKEIIRLWEAGGVRHQDLADKFGIHRSTVCRIINRKRWVHLDEGEHAVS
jgi:HNH endonuclease/Homeodomain-like domain-containing protein